MTKEEIKESVLDYLRDEMKDDPEYSDRDADDISETCGVSLEELQPALDELVAERKLRVDNENGVEASYQAYGARIVFEDTFEEIEKLQKFKSYVHDRLDKMGIEKDPESSHKSSGCRIGGRLDIVERVFTRLKFAASGLPE